MSDPRSVAAMDKDDRINRPIDGDRPGQPSGGDGPRDQNGGEEAPRRKEPARPETLPPVTTSGGLPSEPGWMHP